MLNLFYEEVGEQGHECKRDDQGDDAFRECKLLLDVIGVAIQIYFLILGQHLVENAVVASCIEPDISRGPSVHYVVC